MVALPRQVAGCAFVLPGLTGLSLPEYFMKQQRNPNAWSCLPAAFATALEAPIEAVLGIIGHDGSEITHAGLPEPMNRRGFHPQELIKMCLADAMAVTRVELFPSATPQTDKGTCIKSFDTGGWQWFRTNLFHSTGVIDCRTAVGTGHAMAYQGMGNHALIFDPANGDEFEFRKPEDTEGRDRFLMALWRLDDIAP